ncbi:RNA polymerase sigma factor [Segatella salivae]|jgi:RNA polymerase sigma factor, sigma-70 family|uniref:RNA polymerase sigma factor n=1 Tax=Segatella salivae TaxID=228604 RepID=UPI001C5D11D2|nr:sigma-70 family RNA polymerase sigma factor [Segatella salivae]MBF1523969.1 sigma-70 family RNA polymerase sigma factor [Segatella salivae]MBF1560533.1 sigma-70 family RNA polymerase sigma factor [Segatella salivae]MBW4906463.1 sigma-70 family RNA polymerase sigma factor [Segatella salivae]
MDDDQKQFSVMVRQNKNTIFTVCYMFSKDQEEVNDLFQEVLIRLWQGFDNYKGNSKERTWIYRVALNTCISFDRKKRRHNKKQVYMGDDLFGCNEHDSQQTEVLHKRITRLRPLDRAIVLLWLEDISYEEIGSIIGITAKNVSVRLYRIREQLKNMSND